MHNRIATVTDTTVPKAQIVKRLDALLALV